MAFHNRVAFQASSQRARIVLPLENMSLIQKLPRMLTPLLYHHVISTINGESCYIFIYYVNVLFVNFISMFNRDHRCLTGTIDAYRG